MADGKSGGGQSERLARIESKLDALVQRIDERLLDLANEGHDREIRLRSVEAACQRHGERLNIIAVALGTMQLIGSAIAAWLGMSR